MITRASVEFAVVQVLPARAVVSAGVTRAKWKCLTIALDLTVPADHQRQEGGSGVPVGQHEVEGRGRGLSGLRHAVPSVIVPRSSKIVRSGEYARR